MSLTIKQLQYALAVKQTLHFKKAAQLCSVSPSALSAALNELERQLGLPLFERDNKKVLLTSFGKVFLEKAEQIKFDIDNLLKFAQRRADPMSFPISLGIIPTVAPYLLPVILPLVEQQHPALQITYREEQSQQLVEQVRSGVLDTAVIAMPYPIEGLLAFNFWEERFLWMIHQALAVGVSGSVSGDFIKQHQLMLLNEGHCLKDHALAACQLSQMSEEIKINSSSLHTLVQLVIGKLGSTLVPEMAVQQLMQSEQASELSFFPLSEQGPHRTLAFIARPNYAGTEVLLKLGELFKSGLSQ